MTRPSNILISTVLRNQRFRGPTSSAQQNDFQAEVIRDVTRIQEQWNNFIVPLGSRLPDGTLDETVDAFKNGLDGRTIFANSDANINTGNGQFFINALNRPTTIYEQFLDVYNALDVAVANLENQISDTGGAGGLTSDQQAAIGINIFNSSLQSSPTSIDGRSQQNQINILQLAKDLYGPAFATFSVDGSEILANSVRSMVDVLLELHGGNWDNDISLQHTFSADDITGGTLSQERVGPTSATGTGINDLFAGTPSNLVEDLNEIRAQIRLLKDSSSGWATALTLNSNWNPLTVVPTDLQKLTELKGSATRSNTNPWGYDYTDVENLEVRLNAERDYTGRSSLTDNTPNYSNVFGFSQGDDLTTAIGGLASAAALGSNDTFGLSALTSGHINDTNNPHSTDLTEVATVGGFAPAGQVTIVDSGSLYGSPFVEGALQEVATDLITQSGLLNSQILNLDSYLTTVSGTLQSQIDSEEAARIAADTLISGTLQGQINSNDSDINNLVLDVSGLDVRISTNEQDISAINTSASFRRYEETISGLLNDSSITIAHSAGMYPQVQVVTFSTLAVAGYNEGAILPIHTTANGNNPGVLIEHSGINHVILTNKLDDTLTSGIIIINW